MNDNKNANKEILLNPKDEKEENINNNENEEIFNYINPEPEQNNLLKSIMDDIEYIDIKKMKKLKKIYSKKIIYLKIIIS